MQHLLHESLHRIRELENQLKQNPGNTSAPAELRRATPLVDICTPTKAGLAGAKQNNLISRYHLYTYIDREIQVIIQIYIYIWGCNMGI